MTRYRIISIYSSDENCKAILRDRKNQLGNICLDVTTTVKWSMAKAFSDRKKRCPIGKGDLVIAIDHLPLYKFVQDKDADNLLHFVSLCCFYKWLDTKCIS